MKGFSLIELLVVIAIIGILSAIGVTNFNKHTKRARQTQAKYSLSYIGQAEILFEEKFDFYHENLLAIGAIPEGDYHYDFGFDSSMLEDTTNAKNFPNTEILKAEKCTNFNQICNNACYNAIKTKLATSIQNDEGFRKIHEKCDVKTTCGEAGDPCLKHWSGSGETAKTKANATNTEFKAFAIGDNGGTDILSITQDQKVKHESF